MEEYRPLWRQLPPFLLRRRWEAHPAGHSCCMIATSGYLLVRSIAPLLLEGASVTCSCALPALHLLLGFRVQLLSALLSACRL